MKPSVDQPETRAEKFRVTQQLTVLTEGPLLNMKQRRQFEI